MILPVAIVHVAHASQFWPTVERVLTACATAATTIAAVYGKRNHTINGRIEIAVNGKFADKVRELGEATEKLAAMTELRDKAVATTDAVVAGTDHTIPPAAG